jgi:hypothetical protein
VALAGPPRVVEDADGVERYVLTLRPQGIPAGQHALRVRFRDPATGTSETSETAVRVE